MVGEFYCLGNWDYVVYGGMSSTIVGQDPALISSWKLTVRYYAIFTRMESQFKFNNKHDIWCLISRRKLFIIVEYASMQLILQLWEIWIGSLTSCSERGRGVNKPRELESPVELGLGPARLHP
ncbi:hypothetical protein HanHA300_Chr14g0535561 [Helianthus annuus]|nr:hypothetical protein HanHA300_Chr14g0535561 [Helianthus annuus]KAJ0486779.1 hypothetical protein HanHA89_Chr14g0583351 [Helianthus annuus]